MHDTIKFFGMPTQLLAFTRVLAMAEAARQYLATGTCHWQYLDTSVE
jgi:hypothetical protein